jgi:hypothetical protein
MRSERKLIASSGHIFRGDARGDAIVVDAAMEPREARQVFETPRFYGVPVAMAEGGAGPVTKSAACRPCRIATSVPHLLVFALRNPNNSD